MLSVYVSSHWKCAPWRLDARHRRLAGKDFITGIVPPFSQRDEQNEQKWITWLWRAWNHSLFTATHERLKVTQTCDLQESDWCWVLSLIPGRFWVGRSGRTPKPACVWRPGDEPQYSACLQEVTLCCFVASSWCKRKRLQNNNKQID